MAINAGDILYYDGSAWVNYPGVQAGASGFSVAGRNDTLRFLVTGKTDQGNALAAIQTSLGFPSTPAAQTVMLVCKSGQTPLS